MEICVAIHVPLGYLAPDLLPNSNSYDFAYVGLRYETSPTIFFFHDHDQFPNAPEEHASLIYPLFGSGPILRVGPYRRIFRSPKNTSSFFSKETPHKSPHYGFGFRIVMTAGFIRLKPTSEFASPLDLNWRPDANLELQ